MNQADYQRLSGQVRLRVLRFAKDSFLALGRWRTEDMHAFVERIVPVVAAGQRQIATLTDAYLMAQLAQMRAETDGEPLDLDDLQGAPLRNGAEPEEVYERPFTTLYTALAHGVPLAQAVEQGASRLESLVGTDMQLAKTHSANARLERSNVQFYRRVLVGARNCALCVVASTQRYRRGDLMPIHPGCNCSVAPASPGSQHVLNRQQLAEVHAAVESHIGVSARDAREIDYRELLVIREHGEYGPTLTYRDQHFTGPDDVS